jgi:hypothetical protein
VSGTREGSSAAPAAARALSGVARGMVLLAGAVALAQALAVHYPYFSRTHHGMWWADGHYNLLRSFYLASGLRLYADFASGQFPGHHLLYAAPLWLLGYGQTTPSPALLDQLERTGVFLTGLFQVLLLHGAGRLAGLPAWGAFAFGAFVTYYYLWEGHGYNLPLVETTPVGLLPALVLLLADCQLETDLRWRVRAAVWFLSLQPPRLRPAACSPTGG